MSVQAGFSSPPYSSGMPDRPPNTVADRVRVAVKDSGKTVIDIAKRIGCSHAAIQQWMSGATQRFDAFLMFQFAAETGVELRWLLYGDGPQKAERVSPPVASRALHALAVMEKTADYRVAVALDMLDAAAGGSAALAAPDNHDALEPKHLRRKAA